MARIGAIQCCNVMAKCPHVSSKNRSTSLNSVQSAVMSYQNVRKLAQETCFSSVIMSSDALFSYTYWLCLQNFFLFLPPLPSEFAHRPLRKRFICPIRPPSAGAAERHRAARARAVAAIRRQFLLRDFWFCREGHRNPLAPSATTRRKPASIHYQSNNHAISKRQRPANSCI